VRQRGGMVQSKFGAPKGAAQGVLQSRCSAGPSRLKLKLIPNHALTGVAITFRPFGPAGWSSVRVADAVNILGQSH
jgi:hypothetical protein